MEHTPTPADSGPCDGDGDGAPVYAVGRIGVDFRSEAHRDGFRRRLAEAAPDGPAPDPGNPRQLHDHLVRNPWAASGLTWTLSLDGTPVYALEAEPAVGMEWSGPLPAPAPGGSEEERLALLRRIADAPPVHPVHRALRDALLGRSLPAGDPDRIRRLTVPGRLTDRSARLCSGQVVPVVRVSAVGLARWTETPLVAAAVDAVGEPHHYDRDQLTGHVRALLDKIYFQFRNPGLSAAERALNHALTESVLTGGLLGAGLLPTGPGDDGPGNAGPGDDGPEESPEHRAAPGLYTLDAVTVARSPHCRPGSDCQDVLVRFSDPADERRVKVTFVHTVDVSDQLPVSLAPVHRFLG
ncbi:hypothetical protein [Kitasatospora sp. NPDC008115]|uniref:cyanobactin maturation protease PatG family protein n=1 Tax=Kitasatospora sp. NPDC008115 TaxID=3364022 RepID=UPI0036E679AC